MPGVTDVEIDLNNLDSSIFKAVQNCIQQSYIGNKGDKIRRIWEPTYVIVYKEVKEKSKLKDKMILKSHVTDL